VERADRRYFDAGERLNEGRGPDGRRAAVPAVEPAACHPHRTRPEDAMDEMHKMILEYVKKEYLDEDSDTEITLDTPLISSGIVDSFSMVSLKTFLEKKCKISIPDAKASPEAFDSVNKIAKLVIEFTKG
jgi:acyl carrier protein/D-alanine--poly(phosphoribitol) ligase subunit 2